MIPLLHYDTTIMISITFLDAYIISAIQFTELILCKFMCRSVISYCWHAVFSLVMATSFQSNSTWFTMVLLIQISTLRITQKQFESTHSSTLLRLQNDMSINIWKPTRMNLSASCAILIISKFIVLQSRTTFCSTLWIILCENRNSLRSLTCRVC